jgi:hypothetical protein
MNYFLSYYIINYYYYYDDRDFESRLWFEIPEDLFSDYYIDSEVKDFYCNNFIDWGLYLLWFKLIKFLLFYLSRFKLYFLLMFFLLEIFEIWTLFFF